MPTNRKRKLRKPERPLTPAEHAYLSDQPLPPDADWFERNFYNTSLDKLWSIHRDQFLPAYIAANPGKRPHPWWAWDAPRQPKEGNGCYWDGHLPECRKRLGGTGVPSFEVLAFSPTFDFGVPDHWVTQDYVEHLTPAGIRIPGAPAWAAVDPNDPPVFESQASYLQRHGLLTESEKRWLAKHPEGFKPETIFVIGCDVGSLTELEEPAGGE